MNTTQYNPRVVLRGGNLPTATLILETAEKNVPEYQPILLT